MARKARHILQPCVCRTHTHHKPLDVSTTAAWEATSAMRRMVARAAEVTAASLPVTISSRSMSQLSRMKGRNTDAPNAPTQACKEMDVRGGGGTGES